MQQVEDRRVIEATLARRQADDFRSAEPLAGLRPRGVADEERRRGPVAEEAQARRQPAPRIDHHPQGIGPRYEPRGQPRVVGEDGVRADHDRIAQGAEAMHVDDVFVAGDEEGLAAAGRDEPVEALREMADRERAIAGGAERQIEGNHRIRCRRCQHRFGAARAHGREQQRPHHIDLRHQPSIEPVRGTPLLESAACPRSSRH